MCDWKCIRCGQCCGVVPFEKEDVEKLDTTVQFEEQYLSGHLFYVPKSALKTGKCPFYNRKKKICEIYENRPQVCRDFGDGTHPCMICPHNPRFNQQGITDTIERLKNKLGGNDD